MRDNSHGTGYSITLAYDHNGNRTSKVQGGVTTSYTYDAHDKLTAAGSKTYAYDLNGNCTSVTLGTNVTTLSYDVENRVIGITYPGGATNAFAYNGEDLRTKKVDSTGTQNYVTDGSSPASALLKDGNAVYTPGLSEHRGTASKFTHGDALGSTRGITDSTQTVTDSQLYDAFGNTVSRTGTTPTPFGFVGKAQYQSDSDSGLQLLGHRYYDPSIGRFLSSDPAKAGTNWYMYAGNNPLNRSDALGLSWISIGGGVAAGVVGTIVSGGNPVVGVAVGFAVATFLSKVCEHHNWSDAITDGCSAGLIVPAAGGLIAAGGLAMAGGGAALGASSGGGCFIAGTPVQTVVQGKNGKYRVDINAIDKIKRNDLVLARNEKTGKTQARRVLKGVAVHTDLVLTIALANPKTHKILETLTTTRAHPFYVQSEGFVPAGRLAIGNAIVTRAGPALAVQSIKWHRRPRGYDVYNLVVEDDHTYFVGKARGGAWVHNGEGDCIDELEQGYLEAARELRDSTAASYTGNFKPAMLIGGYDRGTGEIGVAANGDGGCAEDNLAAKLGGDIGNIRFTEPVRPRYIGTPRYFQPVCGRCQGKYSRSMFPPGTLFE